MAAAGSWVKYKVEGEEKELLELLGWSELYELSKSEETTLDISANESGYVQTIRLGSYTFVSVFGEAGANFTENGEKIAEFTPEEMTKGVFDYTYKGDVSRSQRQEFTASADGKTTSEVILRDTVTKGGKTFTQTYYFKRSA